MDEKKSKKISVSVILLILAIIGMIVMGFFLYKLHNEKITESQKVLDLSAELEQVKNEKNDLQEKIDTINNTLNSNDASKSNSNNVSSNEEKNNSNVNTNTDTSASDNRKVQFEFQSMDNAAAQGHPEILKIYEHNGIEMDFEYNNGIDVINSTSRKVSGDARVNSDNAFEYIEDVSGHQYKIVFEFDENKTSVKVSQYDDDNLLGYITLANVTEP